MRVNVINSYLYTPNITPHRHSSPINKVSFNGVDCFEKVASTGFRDGVKTFYGKLEREMELYKSKDIEKIATNVVKRTGIDENSVYNAIGMLTQYSSYKSLSKLEKGLKEGGYCAIETLPVKKEMFMWRNPCLADALSYVGKRNFLCPFKEGNLALIIDTKMLNWLDYIQFPLKNYFIDKNPLYIENFENGYNFFNQAKSLEDFTVEKLGKAKFYQNKNGKSILHNLKYVLNGSVLGKLQRRGIYVPVLKSDVVKNPTPEQIAKNVNPIIPDFESFYNALKDIPEKGDVSKELGEKYVLDYLNDMTNVVTPRMYGRYLKDIHSKIAKYLCENHRDINNVYHIIPDATKSFSVANYMYRQANNIDDAKNLFIKTNEMFGSMVPSLDVLPKNSTVVIMDDYMISGLSMLREQFPYDELVRTDMVAPYDKVLQKKNINIIFAPIIAAKSGKFEFENFIKMAGRQGKDKIIYAKQLPQFEEKIIYKKDRKYNRFQTSSVLPYMGPDTNVREFTPMYAQFLYNSNAQKTCAENIGEAYELFM